MCLINILRAGATAVNKTESLPWSSQPSKRNTDYSDKQTILYTPAKCRENRAERRYRKCWGRVGGCSLVQPSRDLNEAFSFWVQIYVPRALQNAPVLQRNEALLTAQGIPGRGTPPPQDKCDCLLCLLAPQHGQRLGNTNVKLERENGDGYYPFDDTRLGDPKTRSPFKCQRHVSLSEDRETPESEASEEAAES